MRIFDHVPSSYFFVLTFIFKHHLNYANFATYVMRFKIMIFFWVTYHSLITVENDPFLSRTLAVKIEIFLHSIFSRHCVSKRFKYIYIKQCLSRKINKIMSINNTVHKKENSFQILISNLCIALQRPNFILIFLY